MNTNAIISTRNIDINRISFVVGQAKNGRNPAINIKYDGQNLALRLPRLKFPGGVLVREGEDGKMGYTLMATLLGCDPYSKERANDSDDIGKLYNFLKDLEAKIIEAAVENSKKWFGRPRSEEAVKDGFKSLMRLSVDKVGGEYVPNGKYPPSMTLKVPVYANAGEAPRVFVDIIDPRGNPMYVTPSSLSSVFSKHVEANMAVKASIYIMAGGGFGVTWRPTHAQVFQQSRVTGKSVFSDTIENADNEPLEVSASLELPLSDYVPLETAAMTVEIPDELEDTSVPPPPTAASGRRRRAVPAS